MCAIDVDECLTIPCGHNCANVYGSYQCYCHPGYQLSHIDGMTCEGRPEITRVAASDSANMLVSASSQTLTSAH